MGAIKSRVRRFMERHVASCGFFDEDRTRDNCGIVAVLSSSPNWTTRIFCMIFPIKTMFFHYKYNFQLNREEIKTFWSKFVSSS